LIEFAWNFQIYFDLLKFAKKFEINQLDIILNFLKNGKKDKELTEFWKLFNKSSKNEWFNNREEAEKFFSDNKNFNDLINQKYEKLNFKFSIIILRDYKISFDKVFLQTIKSFDVLPNDIVEELSKIVFSQFPPLNSENIKLKSKIDYKDILKQKINYASNSNLYQYHFLTNAIQKKISNILMKKNISISKILNTQGFFLKDLKRTIVVEKTN
jgi:hypothetical protein